MDPKHTQRHFIGFAWLAGAVILLLAWLQLQHGAAGTVGLAIGPPIIAVLLLVTIRRSRAIKRP